MNALRVLNLTLQGLTTHPNSRATVYIDGEAIPPIEVVTNIEPKKTVIINFAAPVGAAVVVQIPFISKGGEGFKATLKEAWKTEEEVVDFKLSFDSELFIVEFPMMIMALL